MPPNNTNPPNNSKTIPVRLPFDLTLRLVEKALRKMRLRIVGIDRQAGTLLANKGFSFKSWGEHILVTVVARRDGCIVQVLSESSVSSVRMDWGANAANVQRFEQTLQQLWAEYARQAQELPADLPESPAAAPESEQPAGRPAYKLDSDNPYAILGLQPGAGREEISEAYRTLIKLYHPDKVAGLAPEFRELAEERSKVINAAYEELMQDFKP